jgi:hypothetical protein
MPRPNYRLMASALLESAKRVLAEQRCWCWSPHEKCGRCLLKEAVENVEACKEKANAPEPSTTGK